MREITCTVCGHPARLVHTDRQRDAHEVIAYREDPDRRPRLLSKSVPHIDWSFEFLAEDP